MMRLVPALLAALALSACEAEEDAPADAPVRAVRTLVVAEAAAGERRSFSASLTAAETMRLGFPVSGKLLEAPLREGERLVRGQVVARLDSADAERDIAAAAAQLGATRVALEAADAEWRRQSTLFERGLVAQVALDRAAAAVAAARAEASVAETALAGARDRLGRLALVAPRDGLVTRLLANPFEELAAGAPVYEVAVTAGLLAEALVPEILLPAVAPGLPAEVRLPAREGPPIAAEVVEVAGEAEAGAAFRVKARLIDPPEGLRTGQSAALTFLLPGAAGASAIPLSALAFESVGAPPGAGDAASVFVVDPATARLERRRIEIAGFAGSSVRVSAGLAPGERVVTAGVGLLREGEQVRLWSAPE